MSTYNFNALFLSSELSSLPFISVWLLTILLPFLSARNAFFLTISFFISPCAFHVWTPLLAAQVWAGVALSRRWGYVITEILWLLCQIFQAMTRYWGEQGAFYHHDETASMIQQCFLSEKAWSIHHTRCQSGIDSKSMNCKYSEKLHTWCIQESTVSSIVQKPSSILLFEFLYFLQVKNY